MNNHPDTTVATSVREQLKKSIIDVTHKYEVESCLWIDAIVVQQNQ